MSDSVIDYIYFIILFGPVLLVVILFVFLTVVLIAGTTVPLISSRPRQSTTIGVSQIVKQIAERVAFANTGTNVFFVEQILTELPRQSSQVSI